MFFGLSCLYIHRCVLVLKILPLICWEESESFPHSWGAHTRPRALCFRDNEIRLECSSVFCAFPRSARGFAFHNLTSFSHPFCNQRSCGCRTNTRINAMICVVHPLPLLPQRFAHSLLPSQTPHHCLCPQRSTATVWEEPLFCEVWCTSTNPSLTGHLHYLTQVLVHLLIFCLSLTDFTPFSDIVLLLSLCLPAMISQLPRALQRQLPAGWMHSHSNLNFICS